MSSPVSHQVRLAMHCAACGQTSEESLSRLVTINRMSCGHCGAVIDLESGDNGLLVQKFAHTAADIDITRRKRS